FSLPVSLPSMPSLLKVRPSLAPLSSSARPLLQAAMNNTGASKVIHGALDMAGIRQGNRRRPWYPCWRRAVDIPAMSRFSSHGEPAMLVVDCAMANPIFDSTQRVLAGLDPATIEAARASVRVRSLETLGEEVGLEDQINMIKAAK